MYATLVCLEGFAFAQGSNTRLRLVCSPVKNGVMLSA